MVFTLTYFNIRGLAELSRLIALEAGIKLENKFVTQETMPALKPSLPFGQVPVLEDSERSGFLLSQSKSIARYLASLGNLVPTNFEDAAKCDMYIDGISDIRALASAAHRDAEWKAKLEEFKTNQLPFWLDKYEGFLKQNGGQFLVGAALTWADIALFDYLETVEDIFTGSLDKYATLVQFKNSIAARPKLHDYVVSADRPKVYKRTA